MNIKIGTSKPIKIVLKQINTGGGMSPDIYDPNDIQADVFDRANHTGTQLANTISDFDAEVSNNTDVAANTSARHTHANKAILDATTASFTTSDEAKLDAIGSDGSDGDVQLSDGSGGFRASSDLHYDSDGFNGLISEGGFTAKLDNGIGGYDSASVMIYDPGAGKFLSLGGNGTVPSYLNLGSGGGFHLNDLNENIDLSQITDNRTATFPDKDGTIAMQSDVQEVVDDTDTKLDGKADLVHTHAIADTTGLQTALDSKVNNSEKGTPNGVATLDSGGKVPSTQLPSYVDDVEPYANLAAFPVTGEIGKIYVATNTNKVYRWSGSSYIEVSPSEVNTVFGRAGTVIAQTGDYTATQITNTPAGGVAASNVQAAINELDTEKAPLASPVFTGNPTAPTAASGDNDTSLATTAFVQGEVAKADIVIKVAASGADFNTSSYSNNLCATIQAAINSVPLDTAASILVKYGFYDWTGSTAITFGRRKIKLIGDGIGRTVVVANYNYTRPIFFQDSTVGLGDIEIAGFTFDASLRPNMGYIHLYQGDNISIHDCHFKGQRSLVADAIIPSRSNWSIRMGTYVQTNASFLSTDIDTATDQMDIEKNYATGTQFTFSSTGTLPSPLVANTQYYAINVNTLIIKVAASSADATTGTAIDITSQGTGTMTLTPSFSPVEVNATTDIVTISQNFATGTQVRFSSTGTLPAPLVAGTWYYMVKQTNTTTKFATSLVNALAGTTIDITDTGTGVFNYQLYNGQSRNNRFYSNIVESSDAGSNEQILFINELDGYIQNNVWKNNANQLAYELMCYINNQNVDVSGNIFENGDANAVGVMECDGVNIHDNLYSATTNYKFATIINSQNVDVVHNIASTSNVSHSNGFVHIFDRVPGPDGFAHIIETTKNVTISANTIDGFNYGLQAQTLDSTYTMAFDEIVFEDNKMRNIRTNAVTLGNNLSNNLLRRVFIRGNKVFSWFGVSTGAISLRGYDTIPGQVSGFYIEDNYIAPSSGSGDSAALRAVGCNIKRMISNSVIGTGQGTYKPIELVNSSTIDECRNNSGYDNDEFIKYGGF